MLNVIVNNLDDCQGRFSMSLTPLSHPDDIDCLLHPSFGRHGNQIRESSEVAYI